MTIDELTVEEAGRVFADYDAYTDEGYFHRACALLRREAPIPLVEADGFPPFYALTRHADVMEAERNPEVFRNTSQPVLTEVDRQKMMSQAGDLATPSTATTKHRKYRAVTPTGPAVGLASLRPDADRPPGRDRMAELGWRRPFAVDIASRCRSR